MAGTPVIFIHGLWLHATSWAPWVELFRENGYDPIAPGWPGEPDTVAEANANPDAVANHGIEDVANHYAAIAEALPVQPVLVGHSFGGLLVQNLLGRNLANAAVAIDAAPIKGVLNLPFSALRVASVALKNPANNHRAVALTPEEFHYGFGNAIPEEESAELYKQWAIPSPGKPLFEAATANFVPHSPAAVDTKNEDRGPLLLIAGGKDHTVPESVVKAEAKLYRKSNAVTDYIQFDDRGHSLTLDHGWRQVAESALAWLRAQGL
ncbi:alpha/beta hydrolase [Cryptosporangium phraense]|uniref:Alpha/beta hydrolase n=1 Tax=Cryptosporangium phraense TaxID=2593070 RepID=A0A545AXL0_9ACTN|nr:alpha/beta fold hydrolase [Cryptosporangium phraense]TQS46060.1 alpha/beta hydrolase [Cryptosporangium phraense]